MSLETELWEWGRWAQSDAEVDGPSRNPTGPGWQRQFRPQIPDREYAEPIDEQRCEDLNRAIWWLAVDHPRYAAIVRAKFREGLAVNKNELGEALRELRSIVRIVC